MVPAWSLGLSVPNQLLMPHLAADPPLMEDLFGCNSQHKGGFRKILPRVHRSSNRSDPDAMNMPKNIQIQRILLVPVPHLPHLPIHATHPTDGNRMHLPPLLTSHLYSSLPPLVPHSLLPLLVQCSHHPPLPFVEGHPFRELPQGTALRDNLGWSCRGRWEVTSRAGWSGFGKLPVTSTTSQLSVLQIYTHSSKRGYRSEKRSLRSAVAKSIKESFLSFRPSKNKRTNV